MKTIKYVWILCFNLVCLVIAGSASANPGYGTDNDNQVCYLGPGFLDINGDGVIDSSADTGDDQYQSWWRGRQDWVNFFWSHFHFDANDWNRGFGYENVDDCDRPLCRTMNALMALYQSTPNPVARTDDYGGDVLHWAGNFAASRIDELDGRCNNPPYTALTRHGGFLVDNWTQIYPEFSYAYYVVERAGIIFHESRHADGYDHDVANWECSNGGSCDSSWDYQGAITYEVLWNWWYWYEAVGAPAGSKKRAKFNANFLLANNYRTRPPFVITCGNDEEPC